MYKYFGIALLGIFATMLIPMNAESSFGPTFYGIAHVTTLDAAGNPTSSQSVHNALIDLGESFLIDQVFQDGTPSALENISIATICITEDATYTGSGTTPDETETVTDFDGSDGRQEGETNCIEDTNVSNSTNGIAVIDPSATFQAGTHVGIGNTTTAIGICPARSGGDGAFGGCVNAGDGSNTVLFALVDIVDFTLAENESATITYTFDVAE